MIKHLTHSVASMLDLLTPAQLQEVIERQTTLNDDTVNDWEERHLIAAEQLCLYAETVYPKSLDKYVVRLRNKLNLTEQP